MRKEKAKKEKKKTSLLYMSMVDQHLGRRGSRYDPTKNCPKTNSIV